MAAAIPMVGSSMSIEHNPGKAGMSVSVKQLLIQQSLNVGRAP
jgi:hypothetical protein